MVLMRVRNFGERERERGEEVYTYVFDRVLCVLHRAIPESLCWHVLEGVTNALLWLHYGYSKSRQGVDWNPIALISIHPGASMLCPLPFSHSLSPLSVTVSFFYPKEGEKEGRE